MDRTGIEVQPDGTVRVRLATSQNKMDVTLKPNGAEIEAIGAMAINKTPDNSRRLTSMRIVRGLPRTATTIATEAWSYLIAGNDSKILFRPNAQTTDAKKAHFNGDKGTYEHGQIHRLLRQGSRPASWQGLICKVWGPQPLKHDKGLKVLYTLRHPSNWFRELRRAYGLKKFNLEDRTDHYLTYLADLCNGVMRGGHVFINHKPEESIKSMIEWDSACKVEHLEAAFKNLCEQYTHEHFNGPDFLEDFYRMVRAGEYAQCLKQVEKLRKERLEDVASIDQITAEEAKDHFEYHLPRMIQTEEATTNRRFIADIETQSKRIATCEQCSLIGEQNGVSICTKARCCGGRSYKTTIQLSTSLNPSCPEGKH